MTRQATERHDAIVTDTNDPLQRGRIRAKSSSLTGTDEALPDWIEPVHGWLEFTIPDVDEEIEIEIVAADGYEEDVEDQAFIDEPLYRWRGKRHPSLEGKQPRPPNAMFTEKNYGKRRGLATPNGHVLLFDDTPGAEQVTLSWKKVGADGAPNEFAAVTLDSDGSVVAANKKGSMLYLDAKTEAAKLIDQHGNSLTMDANGARVIDKFANILELKDGVVQILSQGDVVVNAAANVSLKSNNVLVGDGADIPIAKATPLITWLENHTHPTGLGPSGTAATSLNGSPSTAGIEAEHSKTK